MEVQSRQPDCDSRPDLKQSLLWHLFKSVVLVVFSLWVRRCVWGGVRCVGGGCRSGVISGTNKPPLVLGLSLACRSPVRLDSGQ